MERFAREILARNIRQLRKQRGWSQEILAERSGLHRTYVGDIERLERNVSVDNIEKLAKAFQVAVKDLFVEDAAVPPTAGEGHTGSDRPR